MTKATRILNEYHIRELMLKGNPQYENFYKEELIEFCKISKQEIERLNNIINELENYTSENIEVLENRLNSPFCNFEKVTKELLIFQNYLDKLKELKDSD